MYRPSASVRSQDTYRQPASDSFGGSSYSAPASNSLEVYDASEDVIDLIGDYNVEDDDLSGYGDSESTLFIDIASPLDRYASKREIKPKNLSFEVDHVTPDFDVLDSYKKVTQECDQVSINKRFMTQVSF